jgi:hypothetical protein
MDTLKWDDVTIVMWMMREEKGKKRRRREKSEEAEEGLKFDELGLAVASNGSSLSPSLSLSHGQ